MKKSKLYENIMKDVSKIVKKHLNELSSLTLYNAEGKQRALLNDDDYIMTHDVDQLVKYSNRADRFKEYGDELYNDEKDEILKQTFQDKKNSIAQKREQEKLKELQANSEKWFDDYCENGGYIDIFIKSKTAMYYYIRMFETLRMYYDAGDSLYSEYYLEDVMNEYQYNAACRVLNNKSNFDDLGFIVNFLKRALRKDVKNNPDLINNTVIKSLLNSNSMPHKYLLNMLYNISIKIRTDYPKIFKKLLVQIGFGPDEED